MAQRNNRTGNIIVARIIPLLLMGIVGYATYVITVLVGIKYLLKPPASSGQVSRPGAATAILVIYFLLFIPMVVCFFRLISTILFNPGFVPLGPRRLLKSSRKSRGASEKEDDGVGDDSHINSNGLPVTNSPPSGLEKHYKYDVFVCDNTGRPIWCQYCLNWKPDRAHHCSELNRCILKMDHFCPWVGGMISEHSFKWFIQFTSYASIFCIFIITSLATFTAERSKQFSLPNAHWIVLLVLAAFFGLITTGMAGSSIYLALINSTTVENLTRKTKVTQIAVLVPSNPPEVPREDSSGHWAQPAIPYVTVTYPLEPGLNLPEPTSMFQEGSQLSGKLPKRTFAVLKTRPGENIWDLGHYENWRSVMGLRIWDWFLPLKPSPCQNHDGGESSFPLGPAIDRIRQEAGLLPSIQNSSDTKQRHRKKKSRRSRVVSSENQKDFPSQA